MTASNGASFEIYSGEHELTQDPDMETKLSPGVQELRAAMNEIVAIENHLGVSSKLTSIKTPMECRAYHNGHEVTAGDILCGSNVMVVQSSMIGVGDALVFSYEPNLAELYRAYRDHPAVRADRYPETVEATPVPVYNLPRKIGASARSLMALVPPTAASFMQAGLPGMVVAGASSAAIVGWDALATSRRNRGQLHERRDELLGDVASMLTPDIEAMKKNGVHMPMLQSTHTVDTIYENAGYSSRDRYGIPIPRMLFHESIEKIFYNMQYFPDTYRAPFWHDIRPLLESFCMGLLRRSELQKAAQQAFDRAAKLEGTEVAADMASRRETAADVAKDNDRSIIELLGKIDRMKDIYAQRKRKVAMTRAFVGDSADLPDGLRQITIQVAWQLAEHDDATGDCVIEFFERVKLIWHERTTNEGIDTASYFKALQSSLPEGISLNYTEFQQAIH